MAKTTTTAKPMPQATKFPLQLKVYMTTFTNKRTGETSEPYVAADLIEPFAEYADDFNNVRIAPRWDKDAALFKFRMKRFLRTSDDVLLNGYCEPVGYASKKPDEKGVMVYYPGIFFTVPYSGEVVEFGFKKREETDKDGKKSYSESSDCYVFRDLVSEKWGGTYEPAASSSPDETTEG